MTWINLQRDRCGKEPFLSESQSQEARRFSESLKRLWIYLIDNLITVEHSPSRDQNEEIKEMKGSCMLSGLYLLKRSIGMPAWLLSHYSKTHTRSHTHWHNGHALLFYLSVETKRAKEIQPCYTTDCCCCKAGQPKAWPSREDHLFTRRFFICYFMNTFD